MAEDYRSGLKIIKGKRQMRVGPDKPSRRRSLVVVFAAFSFPFRAHRSLGSKHTETNPATQRCNPASELFRLERVPVEGGAELITIHARLNGIGAR